MGNKFSFKRQNNTLSNDKEANKTTENEEAGKTKTNQTEVEEDVKLTLDDLKEPDEPKEETEDEAADK